MKTKNFLLIFILTAYFYSCGQNDNKTQSSGTTGKDSNTTATTKTETKKPVETNTEKSDPRRSPQGIRINFPVGSTEVTLNGQIDGFAQSITYVFEASKGQKLNASVKPKSGEGNIRISQIFLPSGRADGPFSNQMTYALPENGDYKIILGEDQMAGDPWKGEYLLTISIK
ncbi:MAG: hypothetical protein SGI89_04550 [bacterium]|nr:hypothetical protein [bacterium]